MRSFPGRTLEELDGIDMVRLNRALEALHLETVEERRRKMIAGKLKDADLSETDWNIIKECDLIAGKIDDGE